MKNVIKNLLKDHRRAFTLLITSVLVIVAAAVQAQAVILYLVYRNDALRAENVSVKSNLDQTSYSLSYLTGTARSMGIQLFLDKDIQPALRQTPGRAITKEEILMLAHRMIQYVGTMPGIDSIYIYNSFVDRLYCVNSDSSYLASSAEDFFDPGILDIIKGTQNTRKIVARLRRLPGGPWNEDRYRGVYTYVISNVSSDHANVESSVVINVREQWLVDLIKSMNAGGDDSELFIVDNIGRIVASEDTDAFYKDMSGEPYVSRVLAAGDSSGYFVASIGGAENVVTYVKYDELDYSLIKLTPMNLLQQNALKIRNYAVTVTLLVLFFGLGTIFILLFRLYKPFAELFTSRESHEEFRRQNLYIIKTGQLIQFLTGGRGADYWAERFQELGIKLNPSGGFFLVNFRIDHFAAFIEKNTEKERGLLLYAIGNIAGEVISAAGYDNETATTGSDHVTVIIQTSKDTRLTEQTLPEAQGLIQKHLDFTVTATVSHYAENLDELGFVYNEMLEMSDYRFIMGHASIITPEIIPDTADMYYEYPFTKEQDFINALSIDKFEVAKTVYQDMVKSFKNRSSVESLSIFTHLALVFYKAVRNRIPILNTGNLLDLNDFIVALSAKETLDEVNGMFITALDFLLNNAANSVKETGRYEKLVEDVKRHIENHYDDANLSPQNIADCYHASPVYLSRVFKKYASISIADYISRTRLSAAKKLLEEGTDRVSEIYSQVGFVNKSHFYTFFKRNTGMTPGEYREQAAKLLILSHE